MEYLCFEEIELNLILYIRHMKDLYIKTGIIISASVAILASVPKIIRLESLDYEEIGVTILYNFTFLIICWIIHQYFIQAAIFKQKWITIIISILTCVIFALLYDYIFDLFYHSPLLLEEIVTNRRTALLVFRGLLVGSFQFFMVYYLNMIFETQQARVEVERLKQENLEARLDSLKQQISPHFLFNALNTLKTLTVDPNVKEYTMQLAHVYRYLLNFNENNVVKIEEELKFIESYLYIQKTRFEDALNIDIQINKEIFKKCIPPLSLQTLVENAIKHNVISNAKPLQIKIFNEQDQYLIVQNNLQPKLSVEDSTGKGLQNINDRYTLLSNQQIHITNGPIYFIVKLPLLLC